MSLWRHATRGLRSLLNRSAADRDIADEVEHYFDEAAASLESTGLSSEEARRAVRVEFGQVRSVQERVRAYGWENVVDTVGTEIRHGVRQLYRRPAFALAAVLTLALGIGSTTAIFSVVHSVLIKPLPYPNADELVRIRHRSVHDDDLWASTTMYLTYRDANRTFASIGLWDESSATLTDRGRPELVRALRVADGTLQALGVQPMRGRWFTTQEYGPAAAGPEPVMLSYGFWQRRFGGDEETLGRVLSMEAPTGSRARPLFGQWQVVGIMPPEFRFLDMTPQPDVIVAMRLDSAEETINSFSEHVLARLAPGVTTAAARADLERMVPIWLDSWPIAPGSAQTKQAIANWRITPVVHPLKDDLVAGAAKALWVLMAAIGAVLLIACANIANLLIVRADARRQEFAVRAALGASPARIARALLVESLMLGAAGSILGLGLAYIGVQVLVAIAPSSVPRLEEIGVSAPVLAFTVAVALASTVVFGAIPAVRHARHTESPLSGGSARGSSAGREQSATRSALVVVQVAFALVLVVSSALMIRTYDALRNMEPGFSDPATIHTAGISIPFTLVSDPDQAARVGKMTSLQREILDGIRARPGVASAGFAIHLPMGSGSWNAPVFVEGETIAGGGAPPSRRWNFVSPGYFAAMGIRMIAGRDLAWKDIETGGRVAVVSEQFARKIAANPAAALGHRIRSNALSAWHEVIGVVQDVHQDGLYEQPPSMVYWPVLTANRIGMKDVSFVIRSDRAGSASLANEVRQAVRSVNDTIPMTFEGTMQDLYAESIARTSFALVMLGIAGSMALTLAVVGIYGVIAYVVSQRTREIGIRSALGAEPRQLQTMFLRHGLMLSGAGAIFGLVAAVALGRVMSSLVFGISPLDPAAYIAAVGITISAAALASYAPARRAATIDPLVTMTAE